jgi:hypothetical protein
VFGDLRTNWEEGRLCAPLSYMRTKCEAQDKCQLENGAGTEAGKPYAQQVLCGFDPAPLVDDRYKGVAVHFACVRGDPDTADRLVAEPGVNPVTKQRWVTNVDSYKTVLRSTGMTLRCPFPADEGK